MPADGFKWVKITSQFNKDFIKNCNKDNDEGYFLELDIQYKEKLHEFHNKKCLCNRFFQVEE